MKKFIVLLFMVLMVVGIVALVKHSKSDKNASIDSDSASVIEESTTNFIDPHTIQDPPYNRRIEEPITDNN